MAMARRRRSSPDEQERRIQARAVRPIPSDLMAKGRTKKPEPVDYPDSLPGRYNAELQALISAINMDIKSQLIPAIKRLAPEYTADAMHSLEAGHQGPKRDLPAITDPDFVMGSVMRIATTDTAPTADAWPAAIAAVITALVQKWTGTFFKEHADRIAGGTLRRVEAENGNAFLASVNNAVGIEVFGANSQAVSTALEAAAIENAQLIKSIPEQYLSRVSATVMENMRLGKAPTSIIKQLQETSGITRKRARMIARDQTAKLNGELTKARAQASGLEYFRWSTSKDSRVGDDHSRAARRDVGFGPGVYRWDDPPQEGIPGRASRPNCRCTAAVVFPWELPR